MASKKKEIPVKSPEQFEEDIRLMAYYLWEEKGSTDGGDVEDWIAAELYLNNWIPSSQYHISKATPQGVAFFLFFLILQEYKILNLVLQRLLTRLAPLDLRL